MDPHLGDSSSDSDISNSWSIVDQELCCTETTRQDNSVDKESISGSDGDSLEVIEDEEKRDTDEFRDADVETDGISIITESEINEELDQTVTWTEPKEKKYLHHPNTYLNSRLNVLLAISLAAVFGLGLGHFLGLQEECPLLNESVTAQIEKLQKENEVLRSQLEKLLSNEGIVSVDLHTALDLTCKNYECSVQKEISGNLAENQKDLKGRDSNLLSSDKIDLKAQPVVSKEMTVNLISDSEEAQVSIQDSIRNLEPEWVRTYPWPKAIEEVEEKLPSVAKDNLNNAKNNLKFSADLQHLYNEIESPVDVHDSGGIAYVENGVTIESLKSNYEGKLTNEQISHARKEHNIEAVRMVLSLLESHFTVDDQTSPDAKDTLSSAFSLTSDLEQSLTQLQTAITDSETDHDGFFGQILKKMKESVNRVMNTMEEVADDVDEQMHKVLYKLTRKLKKLKGKLHEKWCHLSDKYSNKSHEVLNWLRSKILLDCKKSKDNNIEDKIYAPKGEKMNENDLSVYPLDRNEQEEKETTEPSKTIKSSHSIKEHLADNKNMKYDSHKPLLKSELELSDRKPLVLDSPMIISESLVEPEQTMSNTFQMHDTDSTDKPYIIEKSKSEVPCWQAQHGTMFCKQQDNNHYVSHFEKHSMKKSKKHQKTTNNPKSTYKAEEKSKAKNEYVRRKPFQQRGWQLPDVNNNVRNNASGEWMMKLAKGRAEQRRLDHRSDWVFDRAHSRRIQRETDKKTAQWYFQRAQGREYCRYHPHSEVCQNNKSYNFQWDSNNVDRKYRKHFSDDKPHFFSKWSRKFTAGKWMKNAFSNWHKVKYHSQH